MQIVIPDDYQNIVRKLDCFKLLDDYEVLIYNDTSKSTDVLAERFKNADAVVLTRERTGINKELLNRLPKLKLISQTGKVSGHVDVEACTERGVAIAEGKGSPTATAELTWSLIMNGMRRLIPAVNSMKEGRWQTNIGDTLDGKVLGIWGFGRIGSIKAGYGKAFGMKVLVWGSPESRTRAAEKGFTAAESKEQLFEQSDVLSLHVRYNKATRGIVSYDDLIRMKPEALFVNTSRAGLLEEDALRRAMLTGRPGRAALDVYEDEPVYGTGYWALSSDNVICTPHLGYVEKVSYEYYYGTAFKNIIDFFGGSRDNVLNPDALNR